MLGINPESSPLLSRSACSPSFFPPHVQGTHGRDLEPFLVSPLTSHLPKSYQPLQILPLALPIAALVQAVSILSPSFLLGNNFKNKNNTKNTQIHLLLTAHLCGTCAHSLSPMYVGVHMHIDTHTHRVSCIAHGL